MDLLKERAKHSVAQITAYLLALPQRDHDQKSLSLMSGTSGVMLYFHELSLRENSPAYAQELDRLLETTFSFAESADFLPASFAAGLAGWGWVMEHLKANDPELLSDGGVFNDLDEILELELEKLLLAADFDLLHGALGIGVYFLKRRKTAPVEKLIQALYQHRQLEKEEIKWKRYDRFNFEADIYDYGLAHGVASILAFLEKCYRQQICTALCSEMLSGGMRFYAHNIQLNGKSGSFFPAKVLADQYGIPKDYGSISRQSWCYGDLAILTILFKTARTLQDAAAEIWITDLLYSIVHRSIQDETTIQDGGFCHGAAGVAHLYLTLSRFFPDARILAALDHWISKLLDFSEVNAAGNSGYTFYLGEKYGWGEVEGLLNGVAGVGLVLLSYVDEHPATNWDECFLLS